MKLIVVGGNISKIKESSIIKRLANDFGKDTEYFNGILPRDISGYDLILWMPEISNDEPKNYPVKDRGAVLILSKVIYEGRTEADAVSRIFAMHGNAVICIYKEEPKNFKFRLIDALGHTWCYTSSLKILNRAIVRFYEWSKGQMRMSFVQATGPISPYVTLPEKFIELNTKVAEEVESKLGMRFFGNFSTRCMKLFPSARSTIEDGYLFSPRNTDKKHLTEEDCVLVVPPYYYGDRMYSVDSPCQMFIYRKFEDINFMIHGHATMKNVGYTDNYYPCGDLREVEEISKVFQTGLRVVNLINHGFLIASTDLEEMEKKIKLLEFVPNDILRD
jgi:hypothetical protein